MGKFRVKPTRAVAKPFKKKPANNDGDDDDEGMETETPSVKSKGPLVQLNSSVSSSKVSKRSRTSALKKKAGVAAANAAKKCVTFSENNTVHVFKDDKRKKESIQEILKGGATALVNLVTGGTKALKAKGLLPAKEGTYSLDKDKGEQGETNANASKGNSLNKVLKNKFRDKKTRQKIRREAFHKKLSLIKESEAEEKAAAKRKETVIVGDMQPLAEILKDLEEDAALALAKKDAEKNKKNAVVPKKKNSVKNRQKEMLDALQFLEAAGL